MSTRRNAILPSLAVMILGLGVLAACATGDGAAGPTPDAGSSTGSGTGTPGSDATSTPTAGGATDSTPAVSTGGPTVKTPFPAEITLIGQVAEGVEAGCMLLHAEQGKTYLLLGGDREMINAGGRLKVRGRAQPGLATTCQQGIPFQVTQVSRA